MGHTTIQLPDTEIRAHFCTHPYGRRPLELFEGIDALVVENNVNQFNNGWRRHVSKINESELISASHRQSADAIEQGRRLKTYCIDTPHTREDLDQENKSGESWLKGLKHLYQVLRYGMSNAEIPQHVIDEITAQALQAKIPTTTARSALVAHKLQNGLIPLLRKKTGHRPIIGLSYGISHFDILAYLKDQALREETLREMEKRGIAPFGREGIMDYAEITHRDGYWTAKKRKFDLTTP